MTRALAIAAVLAIAIAATPAPKPSPTPAAKGGSTATVGAWTVEASQMSANMTTGQFSVPVKILMTRGDGSTVEGDRAVGNFKHKRIALYGDVKVHDVSGNFGLQSAAGEQSRGPATLTSDELLVDDNTRLYDARGKVHYEQGETTADADTAHLNDKTHELTLNGKVHVVQGERSMDADTATYNTLTGQGIAQNDVRMEFPGITPEIATPKPITIKGPAIP